MSLSSGTAGGKGVDSNAVDTYDSGDEWDIGVGNLIIDLDADLEKDKLEMSATKDCEGMAAPPGAVATLPENIKFVSPVPSQGKDGKSKSKRSKNSKDASKASTPDGAKKEAQGRTLNEGSGSAAGTTVVLGKSGDKSAKNSRNVSCNKKDKDGKSKKDKSEGLQTGGAAAEKDATAQVLSLGPSRGASYDSRQNSDLSCAEQIGNIALDTAGLVPPLTIKSEPEDMDNGDCRSLKKIKSEKMDSPISTPAPPPLHLHTPVGSSEISSPCEQIMVRTRSVAVNTSDVALATEPECLGPCEPGTSVNLEGIVWQETEDGMLVVNVTWRNKTYVGTLLDCTRHDWAPPRFCESPTSDMEIKNGRGRGKRIRPNSNTPVNENSNSSDNKGSNSNKTRAASNSKGRRGSQNSSEHRTPPNSNAEDIKASPSNKRKTKPTSDMEPNSSSEDTKGSKRMRTNSNSGLPHAALTIPIIKAESLPPTLDRSCPSPMLIDCPHPNCNKKYKHINGLKYHQARAHNDDDIKLDMDGDSEYGEDSTLHPESGSCNGASNSQKGSASPARSITPKGRGFEAQSPSPSSGKYSTKQATKKRLEAELDSTVHLDGCEDGPCLTDETSNDGIDEKKSSDKAKKSSSGPKGEKLSQKGAKSARPVVPSIPPQQLYNMQVSSFPAPNSCSSLSLNTVVQSIPKSPQLKAIQPKTVGTSDLVMNPALSGSKDKKKKEKQKKKESAGKEGDSPKAPGKAGKAEEGKSPYSESSDPGSKGGDCLLNGSSDPHQSRLASIKAEADKIYSFTDNSPSPSIGVASRIDSAGMSQPLTPIHIVAQNGADNSSVKTNSPAYSDISDAGEDGEGKVDGVKVKSEDQASREGAKKALFPPQPLNKDSPYYPNYETYYSPTYANPNQSPGLSNVTSLQDGAVKVKKEEEPELVDEKGKSEPPEDRKMDISASVPQQQQQQQQQQSVIQQRSNIYMQPLYYNQYAYVSPYGYSPDQAYHNHLINTNPAYRQQCEDRQRQVNEHHRATDKKSEAVPKDGASLKSEEWKQKASVPPTLSKAPSLSDLVKPPPSKSKEQAVESAKSVIIPKSEEGKQPDKQSEGLKMKLNEGGHHGKEEPERKPNVESGRPSAIEQAMYMYRQESDSRLWPYVYPSKYTDTQKHLEEERWKEERERDRDRDRERDRERDRKSKDERSRSRDAHSKEEIKEAIEARTSASAEEHRVVGKDPRAHMQFSSALPQHQSYMPYMHGYPYGQGYDPGHPGYRGMPSVMMQNYAGSYLPAGYSFSPYSSKISPGDDGEKARASPTVSGKSASESKALDILQQHASQYKSKSPTVSEKAPHERDRGSGERDREGDRPRSSPSQRLLPSHHHLGYPLLSGQYDLSYPAGLSSSAIVASQQASGPSLYPPPRR